jgi:hypothetical protein
MSLRFDTPVPNWRSVIGLCAQTVGNPVIAPAPATTPIAAALPFRTLRRETPFDLFMSLMAIPLSCL